MMVGLTKSKRVRCRQITAQDFEQIATLLARNSKTREKANWLAVLDRMSRHPSPEGYPKFGYLIETEQGTVGVLLVIFTRIDTGSIQFVRGNVSSWHVEPEFRAFAGLLTSHAGKHKEATIINVSPGPHTWPVIEAQGFLPVAAGVHMGIPLLGPRTAGMTAEYFDIASAPHLRMPRASVQVLTDHAAYGAISIVCKSSSVDHPVIFRKRRVLSWKVPVAELVYCDDIMTVVDTARPIGQLLLKRGLFLVQADADGPVQGLPGRFFANKMLKYFRGPHRPRVGDLAYTEAGMFGYDDTI